MIQGLLNLYQLDVEVQLLACHFVVGIEGDGRIITGGHLDTNGLSVSVVEYNILSDAQTFAAGVAEDQYGWGSTQFSCLVELWNRESGWMWDAENVYSGAYGIAQALPPSKMGTGWEYNAKVQIDWGLSYILQRYTTPCGAWNHEITYGWY